MKQAHKRHFRLAVGAACGVFLLCAAHAQSNGEPANPGALKIEPALKSEASAHAAILAVTMAGKRVVAVGDYGVVLLSDDGGKSFRQANSVPVSSLLTGVSFADQKNGWAVGQWGAILHTTDGGENWTLQRTDTSQDRPLFSVHFFNEREGVAVGLWSLILVTADGGKTWDSVDPGTPPDGGRADRNLFKAFAGPNGSLFVAAERGAILHSEDRGRTWHYILTDYKGSFWTGIELKSGVLLVGGLRGTVYRSADGGQSWSAVASGVKSSITDFVETQDKAIGVGLDGVQIESTNQGESFVASQREDRLSLTAAVFTGSSPAPIRFSKQGVVLDK
ncbi:MAG: YCF48-related protein [Betaproteobacteria bacterium]|nr:YCF48-related protein [Betaproteobacteria bacterium]